MLIIPSIDLKNGKPVRLQQGCFDKTTIFNEDPIILAKKYANAGALALHLVDLDGAKSGEISQLSLISQLINNLNKESISIQLGGGIRSLASLDACINLGIKKIVIGSIAIRNPNLCLKMIEKIGAQNVILAFDVYAIEGTFKPASEGWQKKSDLNLWDLVSFYEAEGIKNILCTDIASDGMMKGPNFKLYEEAVNRFPKLSWQASGGIRNATDLKILAKLGLSAAILGRALYECNLDLNCLQRELLTC